MWPQLIFLPQCPFTISLTIQIYFLINLLKKANSGFTIFCSGYMFNNYAESSHTEKVKWM